MIAFYSQEKTYCLSPINEYLEEIATVISWNIFQMDGLKFVIPNSCEPTPKFQTTMFDEDIGIKCDGCLKGNNDKHTGIYCKIKDWQTGKTIKFVSLLKGKENK